MDERGADRRGLSAISEAFRSEHILPIGDASLEELRRRYDMASKYAHPSPHAVAKRLGLDTASDLQGIEVSLSSFDVRNAADVVGPFLIILETHVRVLRVFALLFHEIVRPVEATWAGKIEGFHTELMRHRGHWEQLLFQR